MTASRWSRAEQISKVSVLMPVYNEERTLRTIVARVLSAPLDAAIELICVNDGSTDRSSQVLEQLAADDSRIRVLHHPANRGKGAAVRTAIEHMTGDVAVIQDSDLEYDPHELPRLLRPIRDGRADAVFGSRFAASPERRVLLYWHSLGNKVLTWLTNVLNDLNLTDMETCYKAISADVLRSLRLRSERFGIEPEIATRLAQYGARIYEVPISYHGRSYAEGKTIGWRDGMQAIWLLIKYRFVDTRFSEHAGHSPLESMKVAGPVNRWVLDQFEGAMGTRLLEAGCGIGNLTKHLLDRERLIAVDLDPFYVTSLSHRFGHLENVSVLQADLTELGTYEKLAPERIDTVLCVNVLEHVDDPRAVLEGFHLVLEPGGHALILVPAHQWLFSPADHALAHRLRFAQDQLRAQIEAAGFEVLELNQFNRFGVVGWLINRWLGRERISRFQARAFAWLLPLAKTVERLQFLPGLSLVAIARKGS
jgi:SAM-dependent methyltransferase